MQKTVLKKSKTVQKKSNIWGTVLQKSHKTAFDNLTEPKRRMRMKVFHKIENTLKN